MRTQRRKLHTRFFGVVGSSSADCETAQTGLVFGRDVYSKSMGASVERWERKRDVDIMSGVTAPAARRGRS